MIICSRGDWVLKDMGDYYHLYFDYQLKSAWYKTPENYQKAINIMKKI